MALVRILVVDDFEPWRRSIVSIIADDPELQVIHEASDGLEAVQMCQELQPDLVVLDLGLPKVDGLTLLRHWREASSKRPSLSPAGHATAYSPRGL